MGATAPERYAVVSCHVERPLDDTVWTRFAALQEARPGGFRIAALMRPADPAFGEDEAVWAERAREAAARAPLGQHTHWTAPDHARPTAGRAGERVRAEATRLRELGIAPTLFCGGGWYTDLEVAQACAEVGYVDCTPRAIRPPYLAAGEPWAALVVPATVELPSGASLRVIPTTHSLGDVGRDLFRTIRPRRTRTVPRGVGPRDRGTLPPFVHVYFHDTDLLDARRRALLRVVLPLLARRAEAVDLDAAVAVTIPNAPRVPWDDVARL
jgi:hypothetical protein